MPPHRVYIEPFLGDAAVMRAKRPAAVNVGIDLDPAAPGLAWLAGLTTNGVERSHIAIHCDGIQYLKTYPWKGDELVYCDPPYLMSTRSGRRQYRHEMTHAQHSLLLSTIKSLPCKVLISGYWSELYAEQLKRWKFINFEAMTRSGRTKTEWLWFNFPPPTVLHDYQHLGAGFRERERIKRKKARWVARLRKMPALERQALLEAILETASLDPAASAGSPR